MPSYSLLIKVYFDWNTLPRLSNLLSIVKNKIIREVFVEYKKILLNFDIYYFPP